MFFVCLRKFLARMITNERDSVAESFNTFSTEDPSWAHN
jgi:hypothetical protein